MKRVCHLRKEVGKSIRCFFIRSCLQDVQQRFPAICLRIECWKTPIACFETSCSQFFGDHVRYLGDIPLDKPMQFCGHRLPFQSRVRVANFSCRFYQVVSSLDQWCFVFGCWLQNSCLCQRPYNVCQCPAIKTGRGFNAPLPFEQCSKPCVNPYTGFNGSARNPTEPSYFSIAPLAPL